ncbi:hypothetical protein AMATHDRAFT_930 [Amanita thiersii Skay4041]|uniref:NADP-dependent oxidoreductase domain-containing protein n=1 Tax=Amanita thiersii Skay4041 TaxID=703135 RepID=A0A2A9NWB2_9AGAR|nr:hypothetical protein AMATHDRAFT_930 [Amanita thiersii Skay4041]
MSTTYKIIYGTAWKKERTAPLVAQAVLQGFRAIDTACQPKHYQEDLVGEALSILQEKHGIKREDIFIQTKYGQDSSKPLPYNPTSSIQSQIHQSFRKSLSNLRTTYVDSYLLHSPLPTTQQTLEAWRTLMQLQDEGKVKKIGVSNTYDVSLLVKMCQERKVDIVQNRWYEGNGWDRAVMGFCRESGIQYQSFWTLTGSPTLLSNPVLLALAKALQCTPEQAVYRFALEEGIIPLSGTTSEKHMSEDVAVESLELKGETERLVKKLRDFVWS